MGQGHHLLAKGFQPEVRVEAPLGVIAGDDIEKLFLTRGTAKGLDRDLAVHVAVLIAAARPRSNIIVRHSL
jgi:hypothetical protein